ncbi:apoptosis-stimulating of p53 protein 1-like isoform X2 [Littorina saxatilis]|uniref:apoptosis-stimulating of p53 protein 1-like isoform X2 n=1 Tax=Littorina saxatilis TaxID=31220 RepID=UPI0038B4A44F
MMRAGRRSQLRRGSTPTREISRPQWPQNLPGRGTDLTLAELQGLAARQQVAMETQQQALVARETRLKYLQQQEAKHRQLASEQARLHRMRERVEAQELKLKKLRALRGQVEQYKASNGNLNSELEAVRALFNEKEKELAMAVTKVDQLMKQLQELREVKANGVITNGNHAKGDPNVVALELEKLRNELLHRNKLNEKQNSRLSAQRQLLHHKKEEVSKMDNRIHELQQRLKKRRSQEQQPQQQQQPKQITTNSSDPKNFNSRPGQPRKPGQNIAAVEPYIQYAPKDVAKDDLYSKTGFLKKDPKYQTLPANTKFIPPGEEGLKPGDVVGGQEVNNNNSNKSGSSVGGVVGVKPVEYKIPSLISSHFDANRGRGSSGNRTVIDNQGKSGVVVGPSGPAVSKPTTQPTPTQGSGLNSTSQPPMNSAAKGARPFVNTFGKPGLPKWPPQSTKDNEQQQPTQQQQQHQPHQPQINIFDEERQAGSGQSSPASSEGSGPLVKQGSGVFAHPLPASSLTTTSPAGQQDHKNGAKSGPPLEPRGISGRHGPKPPPRMPQGLASVKPVSSTDQSVNQPTAVDSRTGNSGGDEVDLSKLSVNDSVNLGLPQAQSTPQDGKAGTTIHLNQRPAPTYRYASKSVIANTYMGRLGNTALERYQQLNKQIYGSQDPKSNQAQGKPSQNASDRPNVATPPELRTAFGSQQPSPSDPSAAVVVGGGGMTHFGLVGSPNYPDIASDKGSFKANTPKHLRRRHSDSDNEDLAKFLHRGDKPQQPVLENVAEDGSSANANTANSQAKAQNSNTADQRLPSKSDSNGNKEVPSSPHKTQGKETSEKKAAVVLRKKKPILKGENRRKSLNRVSFDPLALLLDASLEGELDLVKRTAKEVEDVSAPNDEGITALHNAICAGHYDIIKYLIEFGADVNSPDSDGWTPLHCAASCNNLPMVRFLVEHGACIFATTISDNETAAEKCEEDEDGYDGCSDYLYSVQEKLGIISDGTVYAVFCYNAQNNDELSFNINDKMTVLRKGDEQEKEWWWARKAGARDGYIARNLLGLYPRVLPSSYQPHETSEC